MMKLFTSHPRSKNQSYFQHMAFALGFASKLLLCVFMLLIHSIFPFIFTNTTSEILLELTSKLKEPHDKSR